MIFSPSKDVDIANLVTFYEGLHNDYEFYKYRTRLGRTDKERFDEIVSTILQMGELTFTDEFSHFVIHQKNASWVGQGLREFQKQLFNQSERYENTPDGFVVDCYKNETAFFIGMLSTEDYLVLLADPWARKNGLREFEIRLVLDGLPLNDNRILSLLDAIELQFGTGERWSPERRRLSKHAVSNISVDVSKYIADDHGWVEKVICKNPLHDEDEFVARLMSTGSNIVTGQKYIIASPHQMGDSQPNRVSINNIVLTDFSGIARFGARNLTVSVQEIN
ncbi:hypothetical protein [Haloferax sp. DFSO60]|uniref:hypothetical protein n=1 Tax=Haloferax sp. DFSO60 TaxID=3388652 RepID=UPI003979EB9E